MIHTIVPNVKDVCYMDVVANQRQQAYKVHVVIQVCHERTCQDINAATIARGNRYIRECKQGAFKDQLERAQNNKFNSIENNSLLMNM